MHLQMCEKGVSVGSDEPYGAVRSITGAGRPVNLVGAALELILF